MSSGSPLARGCLTGLGLWALSALVVGLAAYLLMPEGGDGSFGKVAVYAGLGGGLLLALALGSLWEAVRRIHEVRLLRESVAGAPPADGARIAASGVLVADGPTAEAPFSGTRSAIYSYEVKARQQKSDTEVCSGYFLTPCHVETPAGRVRILGYAELAFTPARIEGPEAVARARAYFTAATVTPTGMGALREFTSMLADDDGAIRSDTGAVPHELDDPKLYFVERAVADGEHVCAFGRYSAERGGLVPNPASADPYAVRLRKGGEAEVLRSLWRAAAGQVAGTLLLAALTAGVLVLVAVLFERL